MSWVELLFCAVLALIVIGPNLNLDIGAHNILGLLKPLGPGKEGQYTDKNNQPELGIRNVDKNKIKPLIQ